MKSCPRKADSFFNITAVKNRKPVVTEYRICSGKISSPCQLVLIGDLHNTEHGQENTEIVDICRDIAPDMILGIGDMVIGGTREIGLAVRLMEKLREAAPVYIVNGNHETNLRTCPGRYRCLMRRYREAGVNVMNNRAARTAIRRNHFFVAGLELPRSKYKKLRRPVLPMKELRSYLPFCPAEDAFSILLAHNPEFIPQYFRWGADLSLSGHNHGGVLRLPGGRALVSAYGFPLPPYGCGIYREDERTAVVTAGLGDHALPVRICNPMEVVVIRLFPEISDTRSKYGS